MNRTTPDAKIIVPPPAREIRNLEYRIERPVQAIVDPDIRDELHTSAVAIHARKDQELAANVRRAAALGSRVR
jgi:hypothetical protein